MFVRKHETHLILPTHVEYAISLMHQQIHLVIRLASFYPFQTMLSPPDGL